MTCYEFLKKWVILIFPRNQNEGSYSLETSNHTVHQHLFFTTHSATLSKLEIRMENWSQSHCSRNHLTWFHSHLLCVYGFKNSHLWSSTSETRTLNCHWKKTSHFRLYYPFFIIFPLSFLILKIFHAVITNKQLAVERLKMSCIFLIWMTFQMSEIFNDIFLQVVGGIWWMTKFFQVIA